MMPSIIIRSVSWPRPTLLLGLAALLCLMVSSDATLAANFNVKKLTLSDLETLEKRRVPSDFPHYATNLVQSCETSKGDKWRDTVRAGWTNDFFWGSHIWRRGARLFEGKRQNRNVFTIRVSYASKTSRANRNNLTYSIKGKDLAEELSKGVSAEYRSGGGYWRRCTLKAGSNIKDYDAISIDSSRTQLSKLQRHVRELNILKAQQNNAILDITKYGLSIDYLFDFEGLLSPLKAKVAVLEAEEKTRIASLPKSSVDTPIKKSEANPYNRNTSPFESWSNKELCQVVSRAIANNWMLRELEKRGLECGVSGEVIVLNQREAEAENARKQSEREKALGAIIASNQQKAEAEDARRQAEREKSLGEIIFSNQQKAEAENAHKRAEKDRRLAEAEDARKQAEEERRLAEAEDARKQAEQQKARILADIQNPSIQVIDIVSEGAIGTIEGRVTDDGTIDIVLVDGQILELKSDGSFAHQVYIPRTGKTLNIVAFDESGKRTEQKLSLDRTAITAPKRPQFMALNPANRPAQINRRAAALIIGIAEYERTPAPAAFADKDAQYFYDYATLKLGVPDENILELINEKADRIELKLAVRNWLTSVADSDTDLYVFFAGHGMGSDDGQSMFLLPYDGTPALLEDSAIRRDQLFEDIAAIKPNSVTVFLDTCYSGSTRESEMLIAARPVLIKVDEQEIPDGFAVFTAASGDQTAKPLPEVEQGLFSYFLMRGLEGEADSDKNGQVTAGELHKYTRKNVSRLSSGSQTPEFQGDSERVLVTFK